MATESPISLEAILSGEFQTLRPDVDFKSGNLTELFHKAHEQETPFSALCISGGGIRSATFALGVIQGLAEQGILNQFDYLSTVSGGGYIGGWLTAWVNRVKGLAHVKADLRFLPFHRLRDATILEVVGLDLR